MKKKTKENLHKVLLCLITAIITGVIICNFDTIQGLFYSSKAEEDKILKVSIGANKTYIDNALGDPCVDMPEQHQMNLMNSYYTLKNSVIRVVYDNNQVVAYFVIVNPEHPFCSAYGVNSKLGEFTYDEAINDFSYAEVSSNLSASSRESTYYSEMMWGAMPANYNYLVYGSYYFSSTVDDISFYEYEALQKSGKSTGEERMHHLELRQRYKPNCYGLISRDYKGKISFLPRINNFKQTIDFIFSQIL